MLAHSGGSLTIPVGETVIGRGFRCDVRFNDPTVSREHVRVVVTEGRVAVEDLGSANGTLLNGEPVSKRTDLADGDTLVLGARSLRVRFVAAAQEEIVADTRLRNKIVRRDEVAPAAESNDISCSKCGEPFSRARTRCPKCDTDRRFADPGAVTGIFSAKDLRKQEKRLDTRRDIDWPVICASETTTFDAIATNISRSGVFVATELLEEIGVHCQLTLLPEGQPAVRVAGVVRHVQSGEHAAVAGIGIQFEALAPEVEEWLERLLWGADE